MSLKKFDLLNDIYYSNEYISLYLKEDEELFDFKYEEDNNFLINKTIKRPIKKIGNIAVNDGFYDLESAYGYGGFYTNSSDEKFLERAFKFYEERCQKENIISEFMRFHPFNNFPIEHKKFLDFNIGDREVVFIDLSNDVLSSYTSKVRNTIKRADEKVTVQISANIEKFIELYTLTMQKNSAEAFYFFDKVFFEKLYALEGVELYEVLYENEVIAMGFFMMGSDLFHYHLSANTDISYKLNANYALLYRLSEIAKQKGKSYFILGGGLSSLKNDPLLKFKKKFSKESKPFYISGKVYNQDAYTRYVKLWEEQSQENMKYFLKYRLDMK